MLLENKGEKNQDIKSFYEGLITARIKGTFMWEVSSEGRKEIVMALRRNFSN